jgi:predicted enzyme related to lactoylglutathione lyase
VAVSPTTMSEGRFARIIDPQGAHLGVIAPSQRA